MRNVKQASLITIVLLGLFLQPFIGQADYSQSAAETYLSAHQNSPWATMALASLGAVNISSDYLKNVSGSSAIDYEAPILAITSLGQDPRNFGSANYVQALESYDNSGQIGDPSSLNDDIFGILALISAGQPTTDTAVADAKNFLLAHQNNDGGWGFTTTSNSDSNMTSSAIVALISAGVSNSDSRIQSALTFLQTFQNSDGGFGYNTGDNSDLSSTSWAVWAMDAASISPSSWSKGDKTPLTFLQQNQDPSGFFPYLPGGTEDSFSPITTSYALIALQGKTLPVKILSVTPSSGSQKFDFRIEGSSQNVCSGQTTGPTALDIVKNAATLCGFSYEITQTSFGPYLTTIGSDTASGNNGWLYFVNNNSPSVGAGDYNLQTGDSVLWYYGQWGWQPTKLSVSASQINSETSATVTAQSWNGSAWQPLPTATIYYGASTTTTDSAGIAVISPADGYYQIYEQKDGFVRSNTITLQVGSSSPGSSSSSVDLNVTIGQVLGTTTPTQSINFSVTPSSLDFGNLSAKQSASKNLVINNNGSSAISVSAQISGDEVFSDNLELNNNAWKNFSTSITQASSSTVQTKLTIPNNISGSGGNKTGQLIFWAQAN